MKFVHAADIHLDSPLLGLERYEGAPVEEIRLAGLMWPEARERWANSAYATVERLGRGQVEPVTPVNGALLLLSGTVGVGVLSTEEALSWGYTGP